METEGRRPPNPKAMGIAVARGDIRRVREQLQLGADPNHRCSPPLLHRAAKRPHPQVLRMLLNASAAVDVRDRQGRTPLHVAVLARHPNHVRFLLQAGANPNVQDQYAESPLYICIRQGDRPSLDMAQLLLQAGANPELATDGGVTPMEIAAKRGNARAISLLLDNGVSATTEFREAWGRNNSPLLVVCFDAPAAIPRDKERRAAAVRVLMSAGANANDTGDMGGQGERFGYPLHRAVAEGDSELLEALLDGGAAPEVFNSENESPLFLATKLGKGPEFIFPLISAGADLTHPGPTGETPLAQLEQRGLSEGQLAEIRGLAIVHHAGDAPATSLGL